MAISAFGVSLASSNGVPISMGVRAIIIGIGAGLAAMALGRIVAGDWHRGTALGAVALLVPGGADWRLPALCGLAGVLLVLDGRWRQGRRIVIPWPKVTEFANVVSVLVMVLLLAGQATASSTRGKQGDLAGLSAPSGARPDIFIILADAYGRSDVLADRYGYQSDFTDRLRDRGFTVASRSQTNYALTDLVMAALFAADQLFVDPVAHPPAHPLQDARAAIASGRILPFLSSEGYETWAISSGYLPDEVLPVENLVDSATMNEFELVSLMNTGLLDDLDQLAPEFRADQLLERLLEQQQSLGEIARHSSLAPQFVFMHMPAPHYPFLVDDDCRARSFEDVVPSEVRAIGQWGDPRSVAYYNAQTRCTERLMLDAVDVINSARPDAIILVMSDHGPGEHLNWFAPSNAAIEERMANFFAARTPGYADPFGPDISAVNILPALLNSSLGTNLPYQPTDQWFGPILGKGTFVRVANGYASN